MVAIEDKYERTMSRIKALLARAEHPNTPPAEAEISREQAEKLMVQYSVDRASLLEDVEAESASVSGRLVVIPNPYFIDKSVLLNQIAGVFSSVVIRRSKYELYDGEPTCLVYGTKSDFDMIFTLFASLYEQMERDMFAATVPDGVNTTSFRKSFIHGFAITVSRRLDSYYQESLSNAAPGTAVALANIQDRAQSKLEEENPDIRKSHIRSTSQSGLASGAKSGMEANISLGAEPVAS